MGNTTASLALFYTTSKLGDVQSFNNGLILTRTEERIHGIEATLDYLTDDEKWGTGGTFTWMKGRERPDNGEWRDMTGYRIPPLKLTAYLQYRPNERWNNRIQANYFGGKDYRLDGVEGFGRRDVGSYFTVDLMSRYPVSYTHLDVYKRQDERWAYNIVKQLGNYGEIFERNVGKNSPMKLERGMNRLYRDGGLMLSLIHI